MHGPAGTGKDYDYIMVGVERSELYIFFTEAEVWF